MYSTGKGVPQSSNQAAFWFGKAADQGKAAAHHGLAVEYYQYGLGAPNDRIQAHMWANLAVSGAIDPTTRANAFKLRDEIARRMTSAQIEEAQRLASAWKPK